MDMIVDFHTHILPGIDDGSSSVEESVEMLKAELEQGIKVVVATPHFYPQSDRPDRFLRRRQEAYEKLIEKKSDDNFPHIVLGAEVYYFRGIGQWDGLKDMKIGNTDYVLIEMPMEKWTQRMYDDIYDIYRSQRLIPIIAHLDRYINIFNAGSIVKRLKEMNVVVQANTSFFTDKSTRKLALKLLRNSVINVIGTDCHNMTSRIPNSARAVKRIKQHLGEEYVSYINLTAKDILLDVVNIK